MEIFLTILMETSGAFRRWIHKAFNYFSVLLIVFTGYLEK